MNPSPLDLTALGAAGARVAQVTQPDFSGAFTESDTCGQIVAVAAQSNSSGSAIYTFNPIAMGSCTVTFKGGSAQSRTLPVTVTVTGFGINLVHGGSR